ILTQALNGRLPCHYCGPCERGCSTGSYFSSQASTLPAARATGRLTIVPDSVVHSLIYDAAKHRVTGVRVVDTTTKQTREYSGRQGWARGAGEPGFGVELKRTLHDPGRWSMGMTAFGECLPRADNYVELADQTDEFGIPVLRIHCTWGDNELAMRKDMAASAAEMLEAAGVKDVRTYDANREGGLGAEPGLGIHEMGTARMGRDPKTSVLNSHIQE